MDVDYERQLKNAKSRYWARREAGVCTRCAGPLENGKAKCESCLQYFRAQDKRWRDSRLSESQCIKCAGPCPDGQSRCDDCLAKGRQVLARQRAEARKKGLCPRCGKRRPKSPNIQCRRCNALDYVSPASVARRGTPRHKVQERLISIQTC